MLIYTCNGMKSWALYVVQGKFIEGICLKFRIKAIEKTAGTVLKEYHC